MDHQILEDLIKILRRNGVTAYECKDLKIHLGPVPLPPDENPSPKPAPREADEDSLLYWSAQ